MAVVDDGSLSLDDKVSKYIPSFNKPGYADITLRQCFSHTSGLPGSEENEALSNSSITLAQSADLIAQIPLIGPPGGQFAYGGLSMQVAGRCVEVATGKSWDHVFQEKITGPLGLTCTQTVGPTGEVCNGDDDDCDGIADNNITSATDPRVGVEGGAPCMALPDGQMALP